MGISIRDAEIERLAAELSRLEGMSKIEVIRQALLDRKQRVTPVNGLGGLRVFLTHHVWPVLSKGASKRWTKREEEDAIGYGRHGEPRRSSAPR